MRPGRRGVGLCMAAVLVFASSLAMRASNWPQWRGPASQGVSDEKTFATTWSESLHIKWKTPIPGRGHSSPIVWGNRMFLTSAIEGDVVAGAEAVRHIIDGQPYLHPDSIGADRKQSLVVMALDAASGRIVWQQTAFTGTMFDGRHRRGSFASATPVTDGKAVYVFFGTEGAFAYGFDGRELWRASVGKIKTIGIGTASSPVLAGGLLILQCDDDSGADSFIVALDTKTGKEAWRMKRSSQVSWSTPVVVRAAGRDELITSATEFVLAYDPRTGKELWRAKGVESNAIHTPLVGHGLIIVSAGYPAKRIIALRPGGSGDVTATHVAWTYDKGTAYVASPILYGEYLYLLSDAGIVTCLEAKTGKLVYEGGRPPKPGKFISSPVAYNGQILITSDAGETYVVKAGPVFEVIGVNTIGEGVSASIALADGNLYIRGDSHVFCIRSAS